MGGRLVSARRFYFGALTLCATLLAGSVSAASPAGKRPRKPATRPAPVVKIGTGYRALLVRKPPAHNLLVRRGGNAHGTHRRGE